MPITKRRHPADFEPADMQSREEPAPEPAASLPGSPAPEAQRGPRRAKAGESGGQKSSLEPGAGSRKRKRPFVL